MDGRKRLDQLFDVALVLIGILTAAELQFITSNPFPPELETLQNLVWNFFLGLLTIPLVVLIGLWIAKELVSIRGNFGVSIRLTLYCWCLWATCLMIYLFLLLILLNLHQALALPISFAVALALIGAVGWAYKDAAFQNEEVLYFKDSRWKAELVVMTALSLLFMAILILLLAVYPYLATQEALIASSAMIE